MRGLKYGLAPIIGLMLLIGFFVQGSPSSDLSPDASPSVSPSVQASATPSPNDAQPPADNIWPNALTIVDVTDATSKSCSFDLCMFLKLKSSQTCSSITIDGETYTADDEVVDDFSQDFPKLKKGKTITVEFGTDAIDDSEESVDVVDSTCWR